ncbi:MAG: site-specific DNA-methyltransferase [Nitrosarchaeum sp.]|nr:site-specific DNA-methyltransferase [Nitrosarchaeum sp.]
MKQKLQLKLQSRTIHVGDVMEKLCRFPTNSIDCIMTSPMYYNDIDLGVPGAWGNERSVFEYLSKMRVFQNELLRVLKPRGTCFINISDSYAKRNHGPIKKGTKFMVPEMFSSQCVLDGWLCENVIQWLKRNAFPTSVQTHLWWNMEPVYFLVKNKNHYFNLDAVKIPRLHKSKPLNRRVRDAAHGRLEARFGKKYRASKKEIRQFKQDIRKRADYTGFNSRYDNTKNDKNPGCLLDIPVKVVPGLSHVAYYPVEFAEWFIKCGCPKNGIVLDPFLGSGTTAIAAENLGRQWVGIELSEKFAAESIKRIGVGKLA